VASAGLAGGLAFLAKGFATVTYVVPALVLLVVFRHRTDGRSVLAGGAVAAVIGGSWPAVMLTRHGAVFADQFFFDQVLTRATSSATTVGTAYLTILPWSFGPWVYLLGPVGVAVALAVRPANDGDGTAGVFAVWTTLWALFVFAFFAIVGNHLWYVLPAYVPLSLLLGWGLALSVDGYRPAQVAVAIGAGLTLLFSYRTAQPHYGPVVVAGGLLFVLVPVVRPYCAELEAAIDRDILSVLALCWLVLLGAGLTAPTYEMGKAPQQQAIGETIAGTTDTDTTVYVGPDVDRQLFPLSFYSGRTLAAANHSALERGTGVVAVLNTSTATRLDRSHRLVQRESGLGEDLLLVRFTDTDGCESGDC
jgi:hypothetical protein